MTSCTRREPALNALFDGELDGLNAAEVEAHARACPTCGAYLATLSDVRDAMASTMLSEAAPAALHQRIEALVAMPTANGIAPKPQTTRRYLPWIGGGVVGALAASLALMVDTPQFNGPDLPDQLIAGHIRSLQASHLTDVLTSDRHVVRPWFNGRLDFSPPVVDLAQQGFPLVGGRLDYVDDRPVAALVYRRRLHTINLFIRRAPDKESPLPATLRRHTYGLEHWVVGDLEYWAVSDVDEADLVSFHRLFVKATSS
ncbi:MAG: anti-sigma factor [Erythrobacter sp.]|jgi:anti-sigma factor RsiW